MSDRADTIARLLGVAACILAVVAILGRVPFGLATLLFVILPASVGIGLLIAPVIGSFAGNSFVNFIFQTDGGAPIRQQFSKARALIVQRKYREAVAELQSQLKADPGLIEAKLLLMTLYYDNMNDADVALKLGREELAGNDWRAEHERIIMLMVDIHLDNGHPDLARQVLEEALETCPQENARAHLEKRLEALR